MSDRVRECHSHAEFARFVQEAKEQRVRADDAEARSADLHRRLGALVGAGNAMAEEIGHLLAGGIEMQPAEDGPVTFEAMLMMLQMLGVYRGQWQALAEGSEGERWTSANG